MLNFTVVTILFFLASQLFNVAVGIDAKKMLGKAIFFALALAISQTLYLWLGMFTGNMFMHLMEGFKGVVVFAALFLIAIRMLMESYPVWKGERSYTLDDFRSIQFAGLAQGVNAFLVGLLFNYLPFEKNRLLMVIFIFALIFSISGLITKPSRNSITFAALLYVIGGIFLLFSSIYIGFFAL